MPLCRWLRSPAATWLALILILAAGAYFRSISLTSWDGESRLHPDERFLGGVAAAVRLPDGCAVLYRQATGIADPGAALDYCRNSPYQPTVGQVVAEYFDSSISPLNPRNTGNTFYVYGLLPITLTRAVAEALNAVLDPAIPFTDYFQIYKVGRVLAALADLGAVLLVFLVGRRLYGRAVGLLGALLLALSVLPIQLSHFFTVDTFTACFTLLAIYWAVRVAQGGALGSYVGLGLAIGLAMATRSTMAVLGLLAIVATGLRVWWPLPTHPDARPQSQHPHRPANLRSAVFLLALAGALTLLTFRVLQPDAFQGSSRAPESTVGLSGIDQLLAGRGFFDVRPDERFLQNLATVSSLVTGEQDFPPSQQWTGRIKWWFPYANMVLWGMGLPLGLAATLGWAAAGWALLRRRELVHLLPWLWVTLWFAWQGSLFGLTMRYYLPIYGVMALLAARVLVGMPRAWRQGRAGAVLRGLRAGLERWVTGRAPRVPPRPRPLPVALTLVVAVGTLLWAFAFTRIYTVPHSRIEASRWIYAHIPPGSTITFEEWDDALPLGIDGLDAGFYSGIRTIPYAEDEPAKWYGVPASPGNEGYEGMLASLDRADYIILSSNRVYDSIRRLPMRYPVTARYYHYLFNGELGFELVADIASYPTLFGIPIPDQAAEEAFSVYDHPRVLIFQKTAAYSRANTERLLLNGIEWNEVYKISSLTGGKVPTALRITDADWPAYRDGGSWTSLFDPAGMGAQLPVLAWLFWVQLLGLAGFALLFRLLPGLPDRGYALSKILAVLLVAYGAWLTTSAELLGFTPANVRLWAAALLVVGGVLAWRRREALRAFWRARRGAILWAEGLFLAVFALFLVLRWLNPDLWHPARGGEKAMDLAYLTATLKSAQFPPYDPWFAGGYINYYYFGFVLVGALVHLSGVVPAVAYNLAVPTLAALTALGAWGVGYNLLAPRAGRVRRTPVLAGLLAALGVVFFGNLAQLVLFLRPGFVTENAWRPEWAFWDATRVISGTINEFPFFTFLFADLHAHMIVLPLVLAAVGLQLALVRAASGWRSLLAPLALLALVAGAVQVTNTWDYPTIAGLTVVTIAIVMFWQARRAAPGLPGQLARAALWAAGPAVAVLAAARLLFQPFHSAFATNYAGFERWTNELSPLREWFQVHGLWLLLLALPALLLLRRSRTPWAVLWGAGGVLVLLALALLALNMPALPLIATLLLLALIAFTPRLLRASPRTQLPVLWGLTALALTVAVELIVARGDIGRMNTVFKLGLTSWVLFALAGGVGVAWALSYARRWPGTLRSAWSGFAMLVAAIALVYPITATPARLGDRVAGAPRGLDGLAFMASAEFDENGQRFPLADDLAAIRWLQQRVPGSPVVLEAHLEAYRWGGRIATFTGLPTILGWPWHQIQQREAAQAGWNIAWRQQLVPDLYSSTDIETTLAQLGRYGVQYIVVGEVERAVYPPEGLAKFEQMARDGRLLTVFAQGQTRIYEVPGGGQSPSMLTHTLPVRAPPPTPTGELLALDAPLRALPEVGEYHWNQAASGSFTALLAWLLALAALTALGLPLAALVFGRAADGGYLWARLVGLLLLGWAVWFPVSAHLWIYNRWSLLWGVLIVLAVNALALWWWGRGSGAQDGWHCIVAGLRALRAHLAARWRAILVSEGLFLAAFGVLVGLRALNPDLWQPIWGGEKPWEFGFLNAILRSPVMPPYDPFFSQGYLNYYYYGLFLASIPIKATGIPAAIGFNLTIATLFALTLTAAFATVLRLTGRTGLGLAAAVGTTVLGNLASAIPYGWSSGLPGVRAAWDNAMASGNLATFGDWLGDWYVRVSRVVVEPAFTINEFPAFSFLFADLHPHVTALPITILVIALAYELLVNTSGWLARPPALLLAALALGTLAVTNSWDYPTYVLLVGAALAGAAYRRHGWRAVPAAALVGAGTAILGVGLYLPFFQHYRAVIVSGIGLVRQPTPLPGYLLIYGLFLAILLPVVLAAGWRVLNLWARGPRQPRTGATPSPAALGLVAASTSRGTLVEFGRMLLAVLPLLLVGLAWLVPELGLRVWLATLLLISALVLLERRIGERGWFILLLATAAWGVSLGMELVFIQDHLVGGDYERMNTVFKFGMQVWVLLAIAAAAALPALDSTLRRLGRGVRVLGWLVVTGLLACTLVYPVVAPISRVADRFLVSPAPTLDGLAFLDTATFEHDGRQIDLGPEGEAMRWLVANVPGHDIVLQSEREFYRSYGVRVAANTGLPTVLGDLHAEEQRPGELVRPRNAAVQAIFNTTDTGEALALLGRYDVDYVYVGAIERAFYRPEGLAKFDQLVGSYLQVAFENEGVTIYAVDDAVRRFALSTTVVETPIPGLPPEEQPVAPPLADDQLAALEAAFQQNPLSGPAAFALALKYQELGRPDDAARVLLPASEANPTDVALQHITGDVLAYLGRYIEAEAAYVRGVVASPTAGNYNKLGASLLAWGQVEKAEIALLQAIQIDEADPIPHYTLAMIYIKKGDRASARIHLERYLALAPPDSPFVDAARAALSNLP